MIKKLGIKVLVWMNQCLMKSKNRPQLMTLEETLCGLDSGKMSLIRFGDGEMRIMNGGSVGFQKYDAALADELKSILRSVGG